MAKKLVTFSRNLGLNLREIARSHRPFSSTTEYPLARKNSAFVAIAKTPEGGIPARAGLVFGSADCTFAYLNSDDELTDFTDKAVEAVFNPYYFPIPGEIYIDVDREVFSGRLLAHLKGGFIVFLDDGDTITARSGTTLGSGTVGLFAQSGATLVDLATTATIYNTTQMTPAASALYLQAKISHDGYLLWDVDDCFIA